MAAAASSGLSVNIAAEDLKYALEGIPGMGQVQVSEVGDCRQPKWRIKWLTRPGDQPMIQVPPFCFCRFGQLNETFLPPVVLKKIYFILF